MLCTKIVSSIVAFVTILLPIFKLFRKEICVDHLFSWESKNNIMWISHANIHCSPFRQTSSGDSTLTLWAYIAASKSFNSYKIRRQYGVLFMIIIKILSLSAIPFVSSTEAHSPFTYYNVLHVILVQTVQLINKLWNFSQCFFQHNIISGQNLTLCFELVLSYNLYQLTCLFKLNTCCGYIVGDFATIRDIVYLYL